MYPNPDQYLQQLAARLPAVEDLDTLRGLLEEVELLYGTLDPEFRNLAEETIEQLQHRIRVLERS